MRHLLDTNVLLRFAITNTSQSEIVRAAIKKLEDDEQELLMTVQNLSEFWNVATRPLNENGFGLSPKQADYYLGLIEETFALITESLDSYRVWRKLIIDYGVSGVKVHDTRLVAIMLAQGVERILTLNDRDFRRFEPAGIEAVHPGAILI